MIAAYHEASRLGPYGADAFRAEDTHGILRREGVCGQRTSEQLGWRSIYAAVQEETGFERDVPAVQDHLIVLHLDRSVALERQLDRQSERRVVPPGGVHIIPGGRAFSMKLHGPLTTVHLYLRDALLREVAQEFLPGDVPDLELRPVFGEIDPVLERLMHAVRDLIVDGHPAGACSADHLAHVIAARCIRRHSVGAEPRALAPATPLPPVDVERALAFMQDNLGRSISLADIAATGGHGASSFSRRFKLAIGSPPHQHLLTLRINRARIMLEQTSRSVADVAAECGFASQEHLSRMFKRAMGASPAAYRRSRRA